MLRVFGLFALMTVLTLGMWVHRAEARWRETVMDVGQELLDFYGHAAPSTPRRLTLNGLELDVVSVTSTATIHELFDDFARHCKARAGIYRSPKAAQRLVVQARDFLDNLERANAMDGVFRQESDSKGVIVCLDTGRPQSISELLERLRRYSQSKDLTDFGQLRAMTANFSNGRTQALLVGSAGPMNLALAFPTRGDAPGREASLVPRPPHARRILDTEEAAAPNALHVYESAPGQDLGTPGATPGTVPCGNPSEVMSFYRRELPAVGWRLLQGARPNVLMAEQAQRRLLVLVSETLPCQVRTSLIELSR